MSTIRVFLGDFAVNVPICVKGDHPRTKSYSITWLIDTTLNIIKNTNKNMCFSVSAFKAETKCCGLTLMPHTLLRDLYINENLPDIELFVCINSYEPLSSWMKLCHLPFQIINKQIIKEQDDDDIDDLIPEVNEENCDICCQFEQDLYSINVDLTNRQILDQLMKEEENIDMEALEMTDVFINGSFNGWNEWIELKSKQRRGVQHWQTVKIFYLNLIYTFFGNIRKFLVV